ncbi:cytochrome P450 [Cryptosporangium minutisporangium]|uniref:Cytochrome P450 n=2 Tax=Cryptosporangium minutisporangium TaxID=113569 RepID=A0ABP6SSX4_9ACTN
MTDVQTQPTTRPAVRPVSRASVLDTTRALVNPLAATVAIGVIQRRPWAVKLAARLDADRRGVRQLQRLRSRYGDGLLRLRVPFRPITLVLSPDDVRTVLEGAPEPFTPANQEKEAALERFEPGGVLISSPGERPGKRALNEAVLDTAEPVHRHADAMLAAIVEEGRSTAVTGSLDWDRFSSSWWRMVRRIVLGDAARDDFETTDLLSRLRRDGNWGPFHPSRPAATAAFQRRIQEYVARAEPGSLAALAAASAARDGVAPEQQIPQWLFAFDAAGIATYRVLALLSTHPEQARCADEEIGGRDLSVPQDLPYLRACVHEAVRLWPTTPAILRDYVAPQPGGHADSGLADGELVMIYAPFFHRDNQRLPYADRFTPDIWLDGRARESWSLVPFSGGPAQCPGRNLVLYTTSSMLGVLLREHRFELTSCLGLDPRHRLPGSVDHVSMRFSVTHR